MTKRPSGRPKALHPRDARVMVCFTEEEIDRLYRALQGNESLAGLIRRCVDSFLTTTRGSAFGHAQRDTQEAQFQRARRAARRANASPQPALEAQIGQALQEAGEDLAADAAAPVG